MNTGEHIIIQCDADNTFSVIQGERYIRKLCWDETIITVMRLLTPARLVGGPMPTPNADERPKWMNGDWVFEKVPRVEPGVDGVVPPPEDKAFKTKLLTGETL